MHLKSIGKQCVARRYGAIWDVWLELFIRSVHAPVHSAGSYLPDPGGRARLLCSGNAGVSAYLTAMALFGIAPDTMKPTALVLNILVALIVLIKFSRVGCFSWRLFWPFAITSIPFAFIGGALTLPGAIYKLLVGVVLLFSARWLFHSANRPNYSDASLEPPRLLAMLAGTLIGLLSGLTGVGSGVFLSPLLLAMVWADMGRARELQLPSSCSIRLLACRAI
jgi:uncharacterized protein